MRTGILSQVCIYSDTESQEGTVGIGRILAKESEDAFSQRKTMAQRLGEEAGTKLLFPMLMMMVVIMVILVVPACMTMHI